MHEVGCAILARVSPTPPAQVAARWRDGASVRLDHATLTEEDLEWLAPAERITFWAVKMPAGFLANLPNLWWLDLGGGSATSADFVRGCRSLRYLALNQIRGLTDLSAVAELRSLEFLSIYGMPQVSGLPSLAGLHELERIEVGSMKGLATIAPILEAPALRELLLVRSVGLDPSDPARIQDTASLEAFDWFAEDVPLRVCSPVMEQVRKPKAQVMYPEDWFARRE